MQRRQLTGPRPLGTIARWSGQGLVNLQVRGCIDRLEQERTMLSPEGCIDCLQQERTMLSAVALARSLLFGMFS